MRLPSAGDLFARRYQLTEELGRGAFGIVYRGRDTERDCDVAVKLLAPGEQGYVRTARARFEREAQIVGALQHPNIVRLLDFGSSEEGVLYMSFEYVGGQDLTTYVQTNGSVPSQFVRSVVEQMLEALTQAHRTGALHRDVKPRNILVVPRDGFVEVKLLDFGIAKLAAPEKGGGLTATGAAVGTPAYMAPEQVVGDGALPQSDIYSLGIVGLEMLCGETFADKWKSHALMQHLQGKGEPPPAPPNVDMVLLRTLVAMSHGDVARRPATTVAALRLLREPQEPARSPAFSQTRRSNQRFVVLMIAMFVVGVGAAWMAAGGGGSASDDTRRRPPPPVAPSRVVNRQGTDIAATADVGAKEGSTLVSIEPDDDACGKPNRLPDTDKSIRPHETEEGRPFNFIVPETYAPDTSYPLVLAFHDQNQTAIRFLVDSVGAMLRSRVRS